MYITTDHADDVHESECMVLTRNGRGVYLRRAHPSDAADLVMIQLQVQEDDIAGVDNDPDTVEERASLIRTMPDEDFYLVADYRKRVVGSVMLRRPTPAYLQHQAWLGIELHRDFRGYGVGSALIQHAVTWGRENGIELVRLGVLDTNPRARALYQRLGFQETGYVPDFVKHPDGYYIGETQMALRLTCQAQVQAA